MLKNVLSTEEGKVGSLATANFSLSGIQAFLVDAEPTFRALLLLAQIAVAVVTVFYVYRKAVAVKNNKPKRGKKR